MEYDPSGEKPRQNELEALTGSSERFHQLFEDAPLGYQSLDADGKLLMVNRAWLELLGYAREEVMGRSFGDFLAPGGAELFRQRFPLFKEKGEIHGVDFDMVRKDGKTITVSFQGRIPLNPDGSFGRTHCIITDITGKKRAEEALAQSDARFLGLVNNAGSGVAIINLEGRFTFVNRALCELGGYTEQELLEKDFADFLHPDDLGLMMEMFARGHSGPKSAPHIEFRIVRKDGSVRHCFSAPTAQVVNGEITGFEAIIVDITDRRNAEKALRESEERFRRVFESGPLGMAMTDMQYRFLTANAAFCSITGYSSDELAHMNFRDIVHPDDLSQDMECLQKLGAAEILLNRMEQRYIRRGGQEIWGRTVIAPLNDADGDAMARIVMLEDVSDRIRLEDAFRESEETFRTLFETMVQGVVYQDADGKITLANLAAQRILGLSLDQMQGRTSMHPEWRSIRPDGSPFLGDEHPSMLALRTGKTQLNVVMGVNNPQKTGNTWINICAIPQFRPGEKEPYRVYTTFDDITERKRAEERIRHLASFPQLNPNPVFEVDPAGRITFNNAAAARVVKESGLNGPEALLPSDLLMVKLELNDRPGNNVFREVPVKDRVFETIISQPEGFERLRVYAWDITDRKRAEEALRKSETMYRSLFENMQEGYSYCRMLFDELGHPIDWIYLEVNNAQGRLTGLDNVVGKRVTDFLPNIMKSNPELLQLYGRVVMTGKPEKREVDISGLGLRAGWLNISAFRPAEGDFVAVFSDITERKKVERTLRRALMRYELVEGRLYVIMEGGPKISFEAFTDLLKAGYEGFVVTRSAGAGSERWRQQPCNVLSLSARGGKGTLPPDAKVIGDWAEGLTPGKAILFDRLDYLVTRLGFKRTLLLVHHLGEIASLNNHIMILSVDPATLDARGVRLLEKEGARIESLAKESVPEDLLETMKQIYEKNIAGVRPTMTSIGRDLGLSKPTVRKRMWKLLRLGYIVSHSRGSSKSLELTEKGRAVFLR